MTTKVLKTRQDMQDAATVLHGLLQGLEILIDQTTESSHLHNAIYTLRGQSVKAADVLAGALDSTNFDGGANA